MSHPGPNATDIALRRQVQADLQHALDQMQAAYKVLGNATELAVRVYSRCSATASLAEARNALGDAYFKLQQAKGDLR